MKKYFNNLLETVRASLESMDEGIFQQLIEECQATLSRGGKIVVSGLGKNVPVCEKFVGTMHSLGLRGSFMNTNSAVHGDIGMVKNGDLVVILTKSGETVESVYLVSLLKQRKVDLWLLTFRKKSTLSQAIPKCLVLDLNDEGDPWNIMPNNSTTINLILLQGLAMQLANRNSITLEEFKRNHPGGYIGEQLKYV